ncbi:hypothetical protein V8E53_003795 [Lactarius tabidus]
MLSPVSEILAGRGFIIHSLLVVHTQKRDLSCMCIAISGKDDVIEHACRSIEEFGFSEPHGDAYDLVQAAPRQRVHSRARSPREPTDRWTFAQAAHRAHAGLTIGFHLLKPFLRFDSFGRNKTYLSGGSLDNGVVAMCAWNLHPNTDIHQRRLLSSLSFCDWARCMHTYACTAMIWWYPVCLTL